VYDALKYVVLSHDPTREFLCIALRTTPLYNTSDLFHCTDIFTLTGCILSQPTHHTDKTNLNLLVLRRELGLPNDFTDQVHFNLVKLFRLEISPSHSLEAATTLGSFPFIVDDIPVLDMFHNLQQNPAGSGAVSPQLGPGD